MLLNDFVIDIVFKLLKGESLSVLAPVKIKFFSGTTDKTLDLFGFTSYSVTTDKWNSPSSKQISNNTNLIIGTLLEDFSGTLTLKFYTNTDQELFTHAYNANLLSGSSYTIFVNSLKVSLPNLTTNLSHFLLNYLFRNVTSDKPTSWYLEFQEANSSPYQSRFPLEMSNFSKVYTNEIGWKCVSYGEYFFATTNSDKELKYGKLFPFSSGGGSWFDAVELLSHNVYTGRVIEVYNNNFVISLPPQTLTSDFLQPSDSNCIFYVDFDGSSKELVTNTVPTVDTVSYNPVDKLFRAECASMLASETVEYAEFDFPAYFTLNMFVRFSTSPTGREITFLEKVNSFKLYTNSSNQLRIDNQDGNLLSIGWLPVINTWYHIYVRKTDSELRVRVNNDVNEHTTILSSLVFDTNSNPLKINHGTKAIAGLCNGLYIYEGDKAFVYLTQPEPKSAYDWQYINSHVWKDLTLAQWYEYCRT